LVMIASIIAITAPIGVWSIRNLCLYGSLRSTGFSGYPLLQAVLPLLLDQDKVLDDPKANTDFIAAVRVCQQRNRLPRVSALDAAGRERVYEAFFIWGIGPGEFLARSIDPNWQPPIQRLGSKKMFELDAQAGKIAWRIIAAHPMEYVSRVAREYLDLFSPLSLPELVYENYYSNPQRTYDASAHLPMSVDYRIYKQFGKAVSANSDFEIAKEIGALHENPLVKAFLEYYFRLQAFLCHLIFLSAIFGYIVLRRQNLQGGKLQLLCRIAVAEIMLFATVASNYLLVALVQVAKLRFAIPCDIELHLMSLIALLAACVSLRDDREFKTPPPSNGS
jgi:hypothetical protein